MLLNMFKMMARRLIPFSIILFLVFSVISYKPYTALAASNPNIGQGMQISPVLVELNAEKGSTYSIKLTIINITTNELVFTSSTDDFKSKDETGTPEIISDSNLPPTASIKSWIGQITPVRLKPKQSQTVEAKVTVPKDAEPGGHYGVIRFSGTPPELSNTGVSLSASAGTLVLIRVGGAINEQLQIREMYAQQSGKRGSIFEDSPITIVERISNTGNVHVKPVGPIVIKNMFGQQIESLNVNQEGRNVLPNSIRKFEQSLNKKWLFGRYRAEMSLAYGTSGQALINTIEFWVIPWRLIGITLIVLITIILLLRWMLRKYKTRIINKSRQTGFGDRKH